MRFASLRVPDARDLGGLKTWIKNQNPLSREERSHLIDGTDFVALFEKQEECWLDKIVERALSKCFPRDVRVFSFPLVSTALISLEHFHVAGATSYQQRSKPSFTQPASH